jgi:uncharacterized membrane protein
MTAQAPTGQPVDAVDPASSDSGVSADRSPVRTSYRRIRVVRGGLGTAGFAGAVAFYCLSLTPSLLPRSWLLQGVVSGLTAAMGYGAGAGLAAIVGRFWGPGPKMTRILWRVLWVLTPLLLLLFLALGTRWQQELRARLDMDPLRSFDILRIVAVSIVVFVIILLIARSLRLATRRVARLLGPFVSKPVAYGIGFVLVVVLLIGFVQGFLWRSAVDVASHAASVTNGRTTAGVTAPTSPQRSGSPASEVAWKSLGRQGRDFVATAPSLADISGFAGRPGIEPVRIYVGLESAATATERAQLAIREMKRTGAFDRAVIAVLTATGTGWVDSNVTESLEYMYGGNTALVSMQYSYLPSWLSLLVDQSKVKEAASALITAVRAEWAAMPAQTRPKLVLFGESLGSYGTENTYDSLDEMASSVDGALFVGPPFLNPIWRDLIDHRDEGSPVWSPVYQNGVAVRFADDPADLQSQTGQQPRIIYLQNSSDPIVWWSPDLFFRSPDWLDDPRGPDLSPDMHWYPGITGWQTMVDMVFATSVPAGHGHSYGSTVVHGWAALLRPPGWTAADSARLRTLLDTH